MILLYSRYTNELINLNYVYSLFADCRSDNAIRYRAAETRSSVTEIYDSPEDARMALQQLADRIAKADHGVGAVIVTIPSRAEIKQKTTPWHHAEGKKEKSHGGS